MSFYPQGMSQQQYEYHQHRKVSNLSPSLAPLTATHIAHCPGGHEYYVAFKKGTCWIQPSDQYGRGYGGSSLFQEGCTFQELPEREIVKTMSAKSLRIVQQFRDLLKLIEDKKLAIFIKSTHDRNNLYRHFRQKKMELNSLQHLARCSVPELIDNRSGRFKTNVGDVLREAGAIKVVTGGKLESRTVEVVFDT